MEKVKTESLAIVISVILLFSIFGYALYVNLNPRVETWEIRVFDYEYREGSDKTYVFSYGKGYRIFPERHEFEIGEYYRIKYRVLSPGSGKIISVEKIQR